MKLKELFDCIALCEDDIAEMANLRPKDTGLNLVMFVSTKEYVNDRHGPRIKISNIPGTFSKDDNFVVLISKSPTINTKQCKYDNDTRKSIEDWITINYKQLIDYWNGKYESDADFISSLTKM